MPTVALAAQALGREEREKIWLPLVERAGRFNIVVVGNPNRARDMTLPGGIEPS